MPSPEMTDDQLDQLQEKVENLLKIRSQVDDRKLLTKQAEDAAKTAELAASKARLDESGATEAAKFAEADLRNFMSSLLVVPPSPPSP